MTTDYKNNTELQALELVTKFRECVAECCNLAEKADKARRSSPTFFVKPVESAQQNPQVLKELLAACIMVEKKVYEGVQLPPRVAMEAHS